MAGFHVSQCSPNSGKENKVNDAFRISLQPFLCGLPKAIVEFSRRYFACVPPSQNTLKIVADHCRDYAFQENLSSHVIRSPLWSEFKEIRSSFHGKILKYLIEELESAGVEICDGFYLALTETKKDTSDFGHRIYWNRSMTDFIVVKEKSEQISRGTTGLSCWQASCVLADYLLEYSQDCLRNSDILELGAGCGLLGLALYCSGLPRKVILTDGNDEVLSLLYDNIQINSKNKLDDEKKLLVLPLDWTCPDLSLFPSICNLIVAADVVYDPEIIPHLVSVIKALLIRSGTKKEHCIIASTQRRQETVASFQAACVDEGLFVEELAVYSPDGSFSCKSGRHAPSNQENLFPFCSSISCPTLIHRITLNPI